MRPDDSMLTPAAKAQLTAALAWEAKMHKAFKGIAPRNERRRRLARAARKAYLAENGDQT